MTPKQFIGKAIEGGWEKESEPFGARGFVVFQSSMDAGILIENQYEVAYDTFPAWPTRKIFIEKIVLDPLAWQAVGKVEGWKDKPCNCKTNCYGGEFVFQHNMHRMIDTLIEGKTIEEFLKTL